MLVIARGYCHKMGPFWAQASSICVTPGRAGFVMALSSRWPKRQLTDGVDGEKKRRRIPLEQVVQELSHAGLTQPALSFVQEVGG